MTFEYEIITGYFSQDPSAPFGSGSPPIQAVSPRFGLLDDSSDRWNRLKARIEELQAQEEKSIYKLIFFGRHGEGFHNVAEAKYGTKAWDEYWAMLDTDGELIWGPDPLLTALGESQARAVNTVWKTEVQDGMPLPEKLYCSPLTRAMHTNQLTFEGLDVGKTVVLENCREDIGDHTCDKRRSKSYIQASFPEFIIEDGFTEEDILWPGNGSGGETREEICRRATSVLDRIFGRSEPLFSDNATYISITAHGGIINGFMYALHCGKYPLPTGGVLPILIKATKKDD
ncbi:histidine phosphatase superfamily [Mycena floridula]|nr:histidine phosphatase superfamily [Mycena floridula]